MDPLPRAATDSLPLLPFPSVAVAAEPARSPLFRRLAYIMLVRVILYTLLLGGTISFYFIWGTPEGLAGPYATVLFVFIVTIYLLNILYATLLRTRIGLERMAFAQIAIDLVTSTVLVHFTRSAESAFVLFLLLSPIASAVVFSRRAAFTTALTGCILFAAVVLLAYWRVLPVLPGQSYSPWLIPPGTVARSLLTNCSAMVAVALLSGYLADQLRAITSRIEEQQVHIDNLAALHADVIRCLTSGLITIDSAGRVLTLNAAAAELLVVDEARSIGKPLSTLAPELAELAISLGTARREEVSLRRHEVLRILGVSVSPLADRNNREIGRIVNFYDLTPLRQMELTMRRSEQLAALGRVAAGVAHEIRNPLASISGSLELLRHEEDLDGENRKLMDIALREIERLDGLIAELLDYARPKPPRLEPLDIGRELRPIIESISGLSSGDDKPSVVISGAPAGLWISADIGRIQGILWNLVRNAWEAGEHERVEINVGARDDSQVFVEVRDRGEGIAPQEMAQIFEPFFTTKTKGSGLGLALVYRVMQDHGGSIAVESEPGTGTTVTLLFPRVQRPAET